MAAPIRSLESGSWLAPTVRHRAAASTRCHQGQRVSVDAGGHQERASTRRHSRGPSVKNFLAGKAESPTFKKQGRHDSFSLTNDQCAVKDRKVPIPKLGWVRMHESLGLVGKVLGGTISRTADQWFLRVTVEIPDPPGDRRETRGTESLCRRPENASPLSQPFSRQLEAAQVRAGLKPGQPIPPGCAFRGPRACKKPNNGWLSSTPRLRTFGRMPCTN